MTTSTMASTRFQVVHGLREHTGRPLLECKTALELSGWDINQAIELLRVPGLLEEKHLEAKIRSIVRDELKKLLQPRT